jgi:hypothetical protein
MGTLVEGGSIVGVPAADYALTSMSELLLPWIVGANATYTWVYIIERESGTLVASTVDSLTIEGTDRVISECHCSVHLNHFIPGRSYHNQYLFF